MFDFEKLIIYQKSKSYNLEIRKFINNFNLDRNTQDQLLRASLSVMLNIAEGAGRKLPLDKRRFFIISRGSVFECTAIFDLLKDDGIIDQKDFKKFYALLEEMSKILHSLINTLTI